MQDPIKQIIREEIREVIRTEMVALEQRLTKIIEQKLENVTSVTLKLIEVIQDLEQKVEQQEQFNLNLEKRLKVLERENENIKENFNYIEGQIDLIQLNQTQRAIRLRGIIEDKSERLMDVSSRVLAQLINAQPLDITVQIEKIYRVNSQIALQNNLPRDIVIYFINKGLRDEIVQASYNREIQWQNRRVCVFKEIPSRILSQRKKFFFLTNEFKNRQIRYKWELPHGLSLIYEGKKYFLNTTQKAEDFYKDVLIPGVQSRFEPEQNEKIMVSEVKKVEKISLLMMEEKKKMEINEVTPSPGSGRRSKKVKNQKLKKQERARQRQQ